VGEKVGDAADIIYIYNYFWTGLNGFRCKFALSLVQRL